MKTIYIPEKRVQPHHIVTISIIALATILLAIGLMLVQGTQAMADQQPASKPKLEANEQTVNLDEPPYKEITTLPVQTETVDETQDENDEYQIGTTYDYSYDYDYDYNADYDYSDGYYNTSGLTASSGVNYYDDRKETYYSSNVMHHYRTDE